MSTAQEDDQLVKSPAAATAVLSDDRYGRVAGMGGSLLLEQHRQLEAHLCVKCLCDNGLCG
jgi:hypothetical protein